MNLKSSNSENKTEESESPATVDQLQAKLEAMEKAGAFIAERMQVAVDFFSPKTRNSRYDDDASDPEFDAEDVALDEDRDRSEQHAGRCEHEAGASGQDASTSEQTSDPYASGSDHQATRSTLSVDPALPPPPQTP